jgi:transcriptional regulator with XRE-family HTH domain
MLPAHEATPNVALFNLRDAAGLTQEEVAARLNQLHQTETNKPGSVTGNTVSRWERGRIERPAPIYRRLLASLFDVTIEELGFTRPRTTTSSSRVGDSPFELDITVEDVAVDQRVRDQQESWRATRSQLNTNRFELGGVAARLYEPAARLGDTGLLIDPGWIPEHPIELGEVRLLHSDVSPTPSITGSEPQSAQVRPMATVARRYARYSHAVRDLARPRLFENRFGYRLLDVAWSGGSGQMGFGATTYFEMVDVYEALAHETALAHIRADGRIGNPSWRRLPFRRLVGNPFDLTQRAVMPSIDTLTIRRSRDGSKPSLVLHQRDSESVGVAGGLLHVMPCGQFQPSSLVPTAQREDFDMWRNIMREYAEEFLGREEHGGDGAPVDYAGTEPFRALDAERAKGNVQVHCLGVAIDALTLAVEVLTVAVFDPDLYDEVFLDMVRRNDEGTIVNQTVPFDGHTVDRLLDRARHPLAPAAAGCLQLAWEHRAVLLG